MHQTKADFLIQKYRQILRASILVEAVSYIMTMTDALIAGNMIGETVAVIAFFDGDKPMVMYNPEILKAEGEYDTEEGCLSLLGGPRKTKRYQKIKVRWDTDAFQKRIKTFTGWTAQIIQHETDHCNGILI